MLSPERVNLASGTETSLAPKPRKPPVLNWIAVTLPSGPVVTLWTLLTLLPSAENTDRPIMGLDFAGAVADVSREGSIGFCAGGVVACGVGTGVVSGFTT